MTTARVLTGARITAYLNGRPWGRVVNFNFRSTTARRPLYGLDSVDPYELAPTVTKIAGTLEILRTQGDGGLEGAGMTVPFEELPNERYFSLQLIDRGTDQVVFQAELCSVISQSWSIGSRATIRGTVDFEAISWSNESTRT